MISVLSNAIPKDYLYPLTFIGSINKWIIFPIATKGADVITWKLGLINEQDIEYQNKLFNKHVQQNLESLVDPLEDIVISAIPGDVKNYVKSISTKSEKLEPKLKPELFKPID